MEAYERETEGLRIEAKCIISLNWTDRGVPVEYSFFTVGQIKLTSHNNRNIMGKFLPKDEHVS